VLADHLTRQGIAVLRYDKRGVGQSGGSYKGALTTDFASDAEAALAFLRGRADIDRAKIGMIGHSEGGLIAPMVAARDPQLGFVVMMAGPGVRGELLLVEQIAAMAKAEGESDADIAQQRQLNQSVFAAMVAEKDHATAVQKAKVLLEQAEHEGKLPAGMAGMYLKSFSSPWFHAFLAHEPGPHLRKMRQAVLVLNGELDMQVPAKLDLDAIGAALAKNPRAVIRQLPKLNHLFQTASTGGSQDYGTIEETMAPIALSTISDWILGTVR
jgi:pimeloyl-ACP methyl ester carboxylesterase